MHSYDVSVNDGQEMSKMLTIAASFQSLLVTSQTDSSNQVITVTTIYTNQSVTVSVENPAIYWMSTGKKGK